MVSFPPPRQSSALLPASVSPQQSPDTSPQPVAGDQSHASRSGALSDPPDSCRLARSEGTRSVGHQKRQLLVSWFLVLQGGMQGGESDFRHPVSDSRHSMPLSVGFPTFQVGLCRISDLEGTPGSWRTSRSSIHRRPRRGTAHARAGTSALQSWSAITPKLSLLPPRERPDNRATCQFACLRWNEASSISIGLDPCASGGSIQIGLT
jgi:hypothetical protein